MSNPNLDKRLAALEKAVQAAEERAQKAEALARNIERENKRLRAQSQEQAVQSKQVISRMNTMRDLHADSASGYADDPRARRQELMRATVKTKDGRRHYYNGDAACYVADHDKPPYIYYPKESIVSLPADQEPSVLWLPVEVVGKDPKTGAPIMAPLGSFKRVPEEPNPAHQVEEGQVFSNTELNERSARSRERAALTGPGAPVAPTPPHADPEPEGENAEGARPSDTEVG